MWQSYWQNKTGDILCNSVDVSQLTRRMLNVDERTELGCVRPADCSWCRTVCHKPHSETDCLQCVCGCVPSDCVGRRTLASTTCMCEGVVLRASSCASAGSTGAGKPDRTPHTPRVFPRCGRVRALAEQPRSRTRESTGHIDAEPSAWGEQPGRAHTSTWCHHRECTAPDAASVHRIIIIFTCNYYIICTPFCNITLWQLDFTRNSASPEVTTLSDYFFLPTTNIINIKQLNNKYYLCYIDPQMFSFERSVGNITYRQNH